MVQQNEKNWWGRNWKWLVPVGCLASVIVTAGFMSLVGFGVYSLFGLMKSSDAYQDAVAAAKADPAVQQALGTPIEEGWFMSGSININGASGDADLSIPISGPNGTATIYVVAEKSAGQWTFSTLEVEIKTTNTRIDLIE
jgi:hypothetical protein